MLIGEQTGGSKDETCKVDHMRFMYFISCFSVVYLIRKSIYEMGLKTTNFFTEPFETAFKRLPDEIIEAYGLDIESLLKTSIKNGK